MHKVEVSHRTIIFTVFFLIFLWFLYQVRQVILLFYISVVFMAALNPLVDRLEKIKVPRTLSIIFFYILILGIIFGSIAMLIPAMVSQTTLLLKGLPYYLDRIGFLQKIDLNDYGSELIKIPGNVFKIASSAFSNIIALFAIFIMTFYLLIERKNLKKHLHVLFADHREEKAERFIKKLETQLGGWVRGEIILMIIVGVLCYIGLRLLDIDFALPLALIAGILEIIPNFGPVVSAIPAVIVGLATSPILGLAVAALYFLVQQLENNIIVPKVMQHVVGLNPIITLMALLMGAKLGGVFGAILSLPILLTLQVVLQELFTTTAARRSRFNRGEPPPERSEGRAAS